jgi:twitching motility two-component system response regulator PilH
MKSVLVVDDSKAHRELVGNVISEAGHHVLYAADGEECLRIAREQQPGVILLDVVMPRRDGYSTCRALKGDPDTNGIPVVLVTTKDTRSDRVWGQRQGAVEYLTKPVDPESLRTLVDRLLATGSLT